MVYTKDLKSFGLAAVRVQVPPRVPESRISSCFCFIMAYFVYILKSNIDGSFYKGYTECLQSRLETHNSGKVKSTKSKRPWNMVYHEEFQTLEQALKRERYFKTAAGRRFVKLLNL